MSILIDKKTRVLIQGITGVEGSRACREMIEYWTKVLAGVRPGAGGQFVENIPVYDTVEKALKHHPEVNTSLIIVPAKNVKDAALEAIFAGIPLINILTEYVPPIDSSVIVAWAKEYKIRVVGCSSIGIISPSGGMTAELASVLGRSGLGQSTVVGIGADTICGSDFADILELFEKDKETKATVIFGEVGGVGEEVVAEYVKKKKIKKPIVALIGGKFTHMLPSGTVLGHAGAIVSHGKGGYNSKIKALRENGVALAGTPEEIPFLLKKILKIR